MKDGADLLAFITVLVWPVIPLFWIPVHGFPGLFKRLEVRSYVVPFVLWLPLAYLIFSYRELLLSFRIEFGYVLKAAGWMLLAAGTALQIWTLKLLHFRGLIGLPEVSARVKGRLVTEGPFSVVRHPTYLAHTMMLAGVFLITGSAAVGTVTLLDFIVINALVIPLEDRELEGRFGNEYSEYRKRVPRFFPRIKGRRMN